MMGSVLFLLLSFALVQSYVNVPFNRFNKLALQCASGSDQSAPVSAIKTLLSVDMKESMKAKQKERLAAIRAIQTAIKQKEVDERVAVE